MQPIVTDADVAESRCDWMVDAVEGSPVAQDMAWWSPDSSTVRFIGTRARMCVCVRVCVCVSTLD